MAISREKLSEIKTDFYTGPDSQNFNIDIEDPFWEWFQENANSYNVCEDFANEFNNETYLSGNCFGNSTRISHQEGIEYCEGFTKVKGSHILHSFNIFENSVIDSTIQSNSQHFRDLRGFLPTEYYGVIIPNDLLPAKSNNLQDSEYINLTSKIYDHYQQINKTVS